MVNKDYQRPMYVNDTPDDHQLSIRRKRLPAKATEFAPRAAETGEIINGRSEWD